VADSSFDALWKHVIDNWDDDKAHGAFLEHCQEHGHLAEAAARYRGMTGDRERGPSAEKRLQAVALLAVAKLESMRSPAAPPRQAGGLLLIAFFVTATLVLMAYLLR
jgi:hypothetical protein